MQYGICPLSIVPLRVSPSHESEMTSQLLYGEHFKILEERSQWCRIRGAADDYEAWVNNLQIYKISQEEFFEIEESPLELLSDLIDHITDKEGLLMPIAMGSVLNFVQKLQHQFEGESLSGQLQKENLVNTALLYLNAPHLWGGKTAFGIDCSGLAQMVYKLNGYNLKRKAAEQAKQGEALSFIEESEAGDLAFFDDNEGIINHVGIMMNDNYIIHVHGKVRIDRIDHSGIFNVDFRKHTHKLRVIKKIL
ncbi:hydrolase Nlp/P60 [Christiangramia fulva]|uniref:Hydrolase Nlp/P60 n=1 Tax=Christiangramia fulva TaxID=2126553 RepID=A0A2R3Z7N9_9FLAO|nr:C40 family peptidase [Christiangramia fulva]AVR46290.1 hydrolase Nlp/P60 [Christiangramia fulva]